MADLQRHSDIGRQADTSSFDLAAEEAASKRGFAAEPHEAEPELSSLRNVVRYVSRERRPTQERVRTQVRGPGSSSSGSSSAVQVFTVPEVDWQSEVTRIMLESAAQEKDLDADVSRPSASKPQQHADKLSIQPSVLRKPLSLKAAGLDNIAPFSCFDVGTVSLEDADKAGSDPLDVFIPNYRDILELSGRIRMPIDELESSDSSSEASSGSSSDEDEAEERGARCSGGEGKEGEAEGDVAGKEPQPRSKPKAVPRTKAEQKELEKEERAKAQKVEAALLEGMTSEEKKNYYAQKKAERLRSVNMNLDGIYHKNKRRMEEDQPRARANIAVVNHSKIAINHLNTRPDLSGIQLQYFHRPRLLRRNRRKKWKIAVPGNATTAQQGSAGVRGGKPGGSSNQEVVTTSGSNSIQSENVNLSVASGHYFLIEYVEEHPPLRVNFGMGSKIINYYRAPDTRNQQDKAEEEDAALERKAAAQEKRQKLLNDCRVPRHVRLLLNQRDDKHDYDYDANIPRLPVGETRVLGPTDESPFLGEVEVDEIQPSIVNALYKGPLFERKVPKTDFLLVCTNDGRKGSGDMHFVLREIPRIFVCGQIEPLRRVTRPMRSTRSNQQNRVSVCQQAFVKLCVARYLAHATQHIEDGVEFSSVEKAVFSDYTLDSKWSSQRDGLRHALKELVSELADKQTNRSTGETRYKAKNYALIESQLDLETMNAPEELVKVFTPEDVCIEESCASAEFRLRELGILQVVQVNELWSWLQLMGRLRVHREYRAAHAQFQAGELRNEAKVLHTKYREQPLAAAELEARRQALYDQAGRMDRLCAIHIADIKKLDEKMEVARFMFDKLLAAPWNTTSAYVHSIVERDGQGRMEIDGFGDPSGCHEAYAFVRIDHSSASVNGSNNKVSKKIYGTDQDLRKLTSADQLALLKAYGMSVEDAKKLKRWDRIHAIRHLSTKAVLAGVVNEDKFARSGAVSEGPSKESNFKKKCQIIWNRQKAALRELEDMVDKMHVADGEDGESGGMGSGSSEAKESAQDTAKDKDKRTEKKEAEDDDDSDFDIDEEDFVENCVTEKAREIAEEHRKRLVTEKALSRSKEEDRRQFQDLLKDIGGGASSATAASAALVTSDAQGAFAPRVPVTITGGVTAAAPVMLGGSGALRPVMPSQRAAGSGPVKAVRRTTRTLYADGTEEIEITFEVSESSVKKTIAAKEREARQGEQQMERGRSGRYRANSIEDEDDYMRGPAVSSNPLALRVGKMRKVAMEGRGAADEVYKTKGSSSRGTGFPVYRLPHVAFAAMLEQELMGMCTSKASQEFWMLYNTVPQTVPRYYEVIERPISLSDIRENIANYKYLNYRLFQDDLDLMIYNARLFNGEGSKIALKAIDIKTRLCSGLELKRRTLGEEKCPIRNFEDAIKKKFLYLGRPIPQSVPLPKYSAAATYVPEPQKSGPPPQAPPAGLGPPRAESLTSLPSLPSSDGLSNEIPMQRAVSFLPGFVGDTSPSDSNIEFSPAGYSPSPTGGSTNEYSPPGGGSTSEYSPAGYSPAGQSNEYSPTGTEMSPPTSDLDTSPYSPPTGQSPSMDAPSLRNVHSFIPGTHGKSIMDLAAAGGGGGGSDDGSDEDDWMINDDDEEEEEDEDDQSIGMDMDA